MSSLGLLGAPAYALHCGAGWHPLRPRAPWLLLACLILALQHRAQAEPLRLSAGLTLESFGHTFAADSVLLGPGGTPEEQLQTVRYQTTLREVDLFGTARLEASGRSGAHAYEARTNIEAGSRCLRLDARGSLRLPGPGFLAGESGIRIEGTFDGEWRGDGGEGRSLEGRLGAGMENRCSEVLETRLGVWADLSRIQGDSVFLPQETDEVGVDLGLDLSMPLSWIGLGRQAVSDLPAADLPLDLSLLLAISRRSDGSPDSAVDLSGSALSLAFDASRPALGGFFMLTVSCEWRSYDHPSLLMRSYREMRAGFTWSATKGWLGLDASIEASAQHYDEWESEPEGMTDSLSTRRLASEYADSIFAESLAGLYAEARSLEVSFGVGPEYVALEDSVAAVSSLSLRIGPRLEWLRSEWEAGSYGSAAAGIEATVEVKRPLVAWLSVDLEAGRRRYPHASEDGAVWVPSGYEDLILGYSPSDYSFVSACLTGYGSLGLPLIGRVKWEATASVQSEYHDDSSDDARIFSASLSLMVPLSR